MSQNVYLAVDLGAGSGRVVAGLFDGTTLRIDEAHRFANDGVRLPTGWHWNLVGLFGEIQTGIRKAVAQFGDSVVSLAVDTWGVDYGLVDRSGRLLGLPWMYRDNRTAGLIDEASALAGRTEIYRRTGLQFMEFNTLYQLMAETRRSPEAVAAADQLLFLPDLLTFWLSGERIIERTIASTSQMLKAGSAEWDEELLDQLGIPHRLLRPVTEPCTCVGTLRREVAESGRPIRVVACGSHDTASAVAGVPAQTRQPLFLSSGTWSLIGRELSEPLVSEAGRAADLSNEQGLGGTTRLLKNVAGMWLLQECKRQWTDVDFPELISDAKSARLEALIDPDAGVFTKPDDMVAEIQNFAARTGQDVPRSRGEITRTILASVALKYRSAISQLRELMPDLPPSIHVVGGGSRNACLNQFTADATGLVVEAGPVEATAAGNILAQLIAGGDIQSLAEGREIVRHSFETHTFEPTASASWTELAARYDKATLS